MESRNRFGSKMKLNGASSGWCSPSEEVGHLGDLS